MDNSSATFLEMKWGAVMHNDKSAPTIVKSFNDEIYFTAIVDCTSIESLIKEFYTVVQAQDKQQCAMLSNGNAGAAKRITLYIDSPGGILKDCFKFIDFINIMKRVHKLHLVTVCTGLVASAGTLMAVIGDERYVSENATCMVHELFGGTIGTYTQLSSGMKRLSSWHSRLLGIYQRHNKKIAPHQLTTLLEKETWFDPQEWVEWGFAEGIYLADEVQSEAETSGRSLKRARHVRFQDS